MLLQVIVYAEEKMSCMSSSNTERVSNDFVDGTGSTFLILFSVNSSFVRNLGGTCICAICLDTQMFDGICVAECYSVERRQLYRIRVPDGR